MSLEQNSREAPKNRPYSAPHLRVYGNVKEITKAVGKTGNTDGGGAGANNKTQV